MIEEQSRVQELEIFTSLHEVPDRLPFPLPIIQLSASSHGNYPNMQKADVYHSVPHSETHMHTNSPDGSEGDRLLDGFAEGGRIRHASPRSGEQPQPL